MARVEGGAVVILTDWPGLKDQIDTRYLSFRFEETNVSYEIFAIDGLYFYTAPIYKAGQAPDSQALYDTYRAEFETYYKYRITDFNATEPFFLTSADGYSVVLKDGNSPTINDGYGVAVIGIDGSNYRMLRMDSSGRPVMVGAGTAGTPVGGLITIQGDPAGTPIPISGNITASNASVSANDGAIPGFSTLIGGSDGTNLRPARIFDLDTGGGTQWILGVGLRKASGGGSVELGTSSDPIRTDPIGTTTQPISGTVTANQGGSWTVSGTGDFTVVQPTASNLRAQLASETTVGTAVPSTAVQVGGSDGVNLRPIFLDSSGRQIIIGAAANGAAVTGNPVLVAGSDGTNARSIRTATDGTVRVDPTGTTTQPISLESGASNLDAGNSSTTPLSGGATFTGTGIDVSGYALVGVSAFTDKTGTLKLQFSSDNSNWDASIDYSVLANNFIRVTNGPQARYFRVVFTNTGTAQSFFRLQTIEKPLANYPSTVPIDTAIDVDDDAIITKSIITGKTTGGGGGYIDVKVNPSGTLVVDASGTTVPVSGTVTANQGTAAALSGKWPVQVTDGTNTMPTGDVVGRAIFHQITDGTNGPVAVKASTTAPALTDPALVVNISPNRPATYAASTNGPVSGSTGATATTSIAYIWHSGTNTKRVEIYRIVASSGLETGANHDYSLRGTFITAENGVPGGTTTTPLPFDRGDAASTITSTTGTFRLGATGAPTRLSSDMISEEMYSGNNNQKVLFDIHYTGKPIVLRASQAEGFEIRMVGNGNGNLSQAPEITITMYWMEI